MSLKQKNSFRALFRLILYAMLGTLMYTTKAAMQFLPNIHLIGLFILAFTAVYRWGALIPIYIFVMLCGVFDGFGTWWVPYLYVWTILWCASMLIPKKAYLSPIGYFIFPVVNGLYGLCFGAFYAPGQALLYGFNLEQTLAWIGTGFIFDIYHCIGNFAAGFLVVPLVLLLTKLERIYNR